jgi:4-alpha-glucanotransferase
VARSASGVLVSSLDPVLVELAAAHGVSTSFYDWRGGERQVSAGAVASVLTALGVDVSNGEAAARALTQSRDASWRRMLPTYQIIRAGSAAQVAVHVRDGATVGLDLQLESGDHLALRQLMVWVDPRDIDGERVGEATFEIPDDVPLGYHHLRATAGERTAAAPLIVVPDRLDPPDRRLWGFMLQLYAVRSRSSWGMGDLHDLAQLATWSASDLGADFVLVNPLHAAAPVPPMEPSPYFPASRRFVNPIYLRVEDVPEVRALPPTVAHLAGAMLRASNARDEDLDRDAVWAAKREVLERAFGGRRDEARHAAFTHYLDEAGQELVDFATWCAIADRHGPNWTQWPTGLRDPRSAAVADVRAAAREVVDFHAWLQFLCVEQLAAAQRAAREAGMALGVLHDLAVGANAEGADAWAWQHVLAPGVTLGCPADVYNQQGQRWNLPAWQPEALAAAGFAPYRDIVRAALTHGGGLRVDHIIGLFRQWWVPDGAPPADATYVRLDHEAMVGILMLEAHRAGAIVVGEDLGNVEPWVREYLSARGLLGTSILWFEHDDAGRPRPPQQWRELCLASVTTHDLPPTAGFLTGEHVELRAELGLLERPVEDERERDEADRIAWLHRLRDVGLLDADVVTAVTTVPAPGTVSPRRDNFHTRVERYLDVIVEALHAYLASTPARLIGVYLPDLVGDRRPVNQPGTVDEYPNWRVPMADAKERPVLLEALMASPAARRLAQAVGAAAGSVTVASSVDQPRI